MRECSGIGVVAGRGKSFMTVAGEPVVVMALPRHHCGVSRTSCGFI